MALLRTIVKELEDRFQVKIHGRVDEHREISDVRLLREGGAAAPELERFILYLGEREELTLTPFHQNCLLAGTSEVPQDCPALYTPQALPLAAAARAARECVVRRHVIELREGELYTALCQGGLRGILQAAHECLDNVVTVCDNSYRMLEAVPERYVNTHFVERDGQMYLADRYIKNMIDGKVVRDIYLSTMPRLANFPDSDRDWMFCSVRVKNAVVGYICLFTSDRPIREEDMEYMQALSRVVSIEMQKQEAYRAPTGLKYEYFLTELLEGQLHRPEQIAPKLADMGFKLQRFCSVMMVAREDGEDIARYVNQYYEKILSIIPHSMACLFHGRLTLLFSHNALEQFNERVLNRLGVFLAFSGLRAAVSYPFEDVQAISRYVRQPEALLSLPDLPVDSYHLLRYCDHAPAHIMYLLHKQVNLSDTIHPIIQQIARYDQENNTEYLLTLRTFLNHNRNAQETAKELHIHKSTFFYRMNRAAELFGIDVNDHLQLFLFEYSFFVMYYLDGMDTPGS